MNYKNKGIVSLIVPCYNGEKYLNRCLDSILEQSYNDIELIIVNDGSTDNSEKIIQNRKKEIEDRLWAFKYIYQNNGGVGAAVNKALKFFSGEYLALLDVDDYMMWNAIQLKVEWLNTHLEYNAVFNNGYFVKEESYFLDETVFYQQDYEWNEDVFSQIIHAKILNFPGSYMIRSSSWLERCPTREIYPSRNGQNMQIILPATYHAKTGYINKPLMRYLVREESLSHFKNNKEEKSFAASNEYQKIYLNVVTEICDKNELEGIVDQINETFNRSRMQLHGNFHNKKLLKKYYNYLKKQNRLLKEDIVFYYKMKYKVLRVAAYVLHKMKNLLS